MSLFITLLFWKGLYIYFNIFIEEHIISDPKKVRVFQFSQHEAITFLVLQPLMFFFSGECSREYEFKMSKNLRSIFFSDKLLGVNLLFHNVEKWPNILEKYCGVDTARFSKFVWLFFNIMK